jgi:glycine/D-amino acid oxidase-like deaminating enzyme
MFGADITRTGYYGFPATTDGVVKFGRHGPGREMSPDAAERVVMPEEQKSFREFLAWAFPNLVDAPIVFTRICLYCDTNDGDFWIAQDPGRSGFFITAGDSGHGFKFAPVLGEIVADALEGKANPLLAKFRWRPEVAPGQKKEAARFVPE